MKEFIFGLDPGSRNTGFGVVAVQGDRMTHVAHGVIKLKEQWTPHERLRVLYEDLQTLFAKYPASTVVIEKIFFGKNADSAFKLGHARGVAMLAASQHGAMIAEYAARYVKKAITGSGAADKSQVQVLVYNKLGIRPVESGFDASDALSLAVCHVQVRDSVARIQQMLEGAP